MFSMFLFLSSKLEEITFCLGKMFFVKKLCKWGIRRVSFEGAGFCTKLPFYKKSVYFNGS